MGRWIKNKLIPFLQILGKPISFLLDLILIPIIFFSGIFLKFYRKVGSKRFPINTNLLKKIGVFPIIDHFYEPFFNHKTLTEDFSKIRNLPSINFREQEQLDLLKSFKFQKDFQSFLDSEADLKTLRSFSITNGSYGAGDAEILFNFLRLKKPSKIIEIGSGNSTKVIEAALKLNIKEGSNPKFTCIEPYKPWLKSTEHIKILRSKLEQTSLDWTKELSDGDFLFIDSSHMIRPQGDVLYEYLEVIPMLNTGVFVHVHDIFSPRDYPETWLKTDVKFWNEQYLLETLLSNSNRYKVIASLNYLAKDYFEELKKVCPHLNAKHEPAAFYFEVI
tara:strand:- start:318 stop:1313 length:996 start_codon:yes stop_codon:yes gene_type:complete